MYSVVIGAQKVNVFSNIGDTSEPVFSVSIMGNGFHMDHKAIPSDSALAKVHFNACIHAIDRAKDISQHRNTKMHMAILQVNNYEQI